MRAKKTIRISLGVKTAIGIVFIAAILSAVAIILATRLIKRRWTIS